MSEKVIDKSGDQNSPRTCTIFQPDNKTLKKRKIKKYSYQNDDCYSNKYNLIQINQNENLNKNLNLNINDEPEFELKYEDEYQGLMYYPRNNDIENIYYQTDRDEYNNFKTKWKTEICRYWEMYGQCKFGDNCAFAHGDSELKKRKMTFNYKTKPCKQFFELGYCSYGSRCQFSHKKEDAIGKNDKNDEISYLKIIKEFLSSEKEISHELVKRPRLMTFEKITESTLEESEKSKLELYEDIINIKNGKHSRKRNSDDSFYTNFSSDNNENNNDRDFF